MRALVLAAIGLAAMCGHADQVAVPDWLPEDFRFAVSSNEAAEVEQTLTLMRDALHPKLIEMMWAADSTTNNQQLTTNNYPALLGPTLQWIVHVSQPGKSDEAGYFETFKPGYQLTFDRTTLTNRASRLSLLPPVVKLALVYDDKNRGAVTRAIPGVDYPGVTSEDEGTTAHDIHFVLRAPKCKRRLRVRAASTQGHEMEFKWLVLTGSAEIPGWERREVTSNSQLQDVFVHQDRIQKGSSVLMAVFAREKGRMWGVPSFIHVEADALCRHEYFNGEILAVDYGDYRDTYNLDEKGRIMGFERLDKSSLSKTRFSNQGEVVIEAYPNDTPKVTRKVKYFVEDGKLNYKVLDEDVHYKMESMEHRSNNW